MKTKQRRLSAQRKMRAYRNRLRQQGLRPVQLWVPDTRSPRFVAEARRQSLLLRNDHAENDVLDFIEAVSDTVGWRS